MDGKIKRAGVEKERERGRKRKEGEERGDSRWRGFDEAAMFNRCWPASGWSRTPQPGVGGRHGPDDDIGRSGVAQAEPGWGCAVPIRRTMEAGCSFVCGHCCSPGRKHEPRTLLFPSLSPSLFLSLSLPLAFAIRASSSSMSPFLPAYLFPVWKYRDDSANRVARRSQVDGAKIRDNRFHHVQPRVDAQCWMCPTRPLTYRLVKVRIGSRYVI